MDVPAAPGCEARSFTGARRLAGVRKSYTLANMKSAVSATPRRILGLIGPVALLWDPRGWNNGIIPIIMKMVSYNEILVTVNFTLSHGGSD